MQNAIISQLKSISQQDYRDPKSFNHIIKSLIKLQETENCTDIKTLLHSMHDELSQTKYSDYKISQANWAHFLLHQFIL